jgi:hypothetical protein
MLVRCESHEHPYQQSMTNRQELAKNDGEIDRSGCPTRRARGRLDSHRHIGLFHGFGFCPFRGQVHVPPAVADAQDVGGSLHNLSKQLELKMILDLKQQLAHILWIGGATDMGKSTVAQTLAARHEWYVYHYNEKDVEHHLKLVDTVPEIQKFNAASLDERFSRVGNDQCEG